MEEYFEGETIPKIEKGFLKKSVAYVLMCKDELDERIVPFLGDEWSMHKLGALLSSILRMAAYEITQDTKIPTTVVVSEYVHIAGEFLAEDDVKFVNAVVDNMVKILRDSDTVPQKVHVSSRTDMPKKPRVITEVRKARIKSESDKPVLTLKKKTDDT